MGESSSHDGNGQAKEPPLPPPAPSSSPSLERSTRLAYASPVALDAATRDSETVGPGKGACEKEKFIFLSFSFSEFSREN